METYTSTKNYSYLPAFWFGKFGKSSLACKLAFSQFLSLFLFSGLFIFQTNLFAQCDAHAGSLTADCSNGEFCLVAGSVEISASDDGNSQIPNGYSKLYILSRGNAQSYVESSNSPEFTVSRTGRYYMHILVYNNTPSSPEYLDLSSFVPGQSDISDLVSLISHSGVCADLNQAGSYMRVRKCLIPFLIQARDDFLNTLANQAVEGNIFINDMLQAGQSYDLHIIGGPFNGSLIQNPDGSMIYTPDPNFVGQDEYTYRVCDNTVCPARCAQATVYIEVLNPLPQNNPPVANLDAVCIPAGDNIDIVVRANDIDPDGDVLSLPNPISGPSHGVVSYKQDGSINYTPNANFSGYDSFEYEICDQGSPNLCDIGLVSIRVKTGLGNGSPPIPMDDAITLPKNTGRFGETVIENDYEPDGDPVSFTLDTPPQHGIVTFSLNGDYDYVPNTDYVGPDHFVYTMTDIDGSAKANVIITVHGLESIFPVEWLAFSARIENGFARLEWSTSLELNSSYFDIERSRDGGNTFQKMGEIPAAGTSNQVQSYQFQDPGVLNLGVEKLLYRLKQVDLDGNYSYSRILKLDLSPQSRINLIAFPNPAQEEVEITWSATEKVYQIRIIDLLGKVVYRKDFNKAAQFGSFIYDLNGLGAGFYVIQAFSNSARTSLRLQLK
ncbi:MAG: Ig-like domain-containing protein [Bacteroidota bacterium]